MSTAKCLNQQPRAALAAPGVLIAIALGAATGALGRETVCALLNPHLESGGFPLGTLVANLSGAFLLGLMATWLDRLIRHDLFRPFWESGLIRSYTTLSTFSLEGLSLIEQAAWGVFVTYALLSIGGGLFCISMGERLGRSIASARGIEVDDERRDRVEESL